MPTLYKRNAQGKPIFWNAEIQEFGGINVVYGLVGKDGHKEHIITHRKESAELNSMIEAKRKEGYKEIRDLYDNAPEFVQGDTLIHYLDTYLPKDNTHYDGAFIPMLCKTLEDNKPFTKATYFGQWKINGERCIITADRSDDLFQTITLHYRSRQGVDWTDKLSYLTPILIPFIKGEILDMMIEEGIGLDGELYLPEYGINDINSFIKNVDMPQHYQLQYWCYDLCMPEATAGKRHSILTNSLSRYIPMITCKADHLANKDPFVILPTKVIIDIQQATESRDKFIDLGFEGLVIRDESALYQFGGKRNSAMFKYKKIEDGLFDVIDIKEDKRGLPIFTLKNDINDETFDATINLPQEKQRWFLQIKQSVIEHGKALVEFRERSGRKQVPFHAKIIKIDL